jgi:hypothetical protein
MERQSWLVLTHQPATAVHLLEKELRRAVASNDGLGNTIAEVLALIERDPRLVSPLPIPTPQGTRRQEICGHFDRMEAALPCATLMLFHGGGLTGRRMAETCFRTVRHDLSAGLARRERRSELLRDLAIPGLETTYGFFLRVVLQAHWTANGMPFKNDLSFGRMVTLVGQLGLVPQSLWIDAGHVRNAAAHGYWRYDPISDRVLLQDRSWQQSYELKDLHRLLRRAHGTIADLYFALGRSVAKNASRPLLEVLQLSVGRSAEAMVALQAFQRSTTDAYTTLVGLGWQDLASAPSAGS